MFHLPTIFLPNWKQVAVRLGVGALPGFICSLFGHPWLGLWTALVLAVGFGVDSYTTGENKNAVLVDIGVVTLGAGLGILLRHLL